MTGDMTVGNPGKKLFRFALPLVAGNLFQQLYNIVDSLVVGNFEGADALAAVGASASITFLFVAAAFGLGIGTSVVIAQFFGAGKLGKVKTAVFTILISVVILGIFLTIFGVLGSKVFLRFLNAPENIMNEATTYLQIYFWGIIFLFSYNMLTAIFNALGDSVMPLIFLAVSSVLNIGLDLLFVIRFQMGVAGVAWATLIAQALSAVVSFVVLMRRIKKMDIQEEFSWFDVPILKKILVSAVPSMLQQAIVSFGMLFVQALVNGYGSVVVAGYTAATKIDAIAINPMVNVGSAVSTFTAQNIGAGKPERISRGVRAGLIMSGVIALTVTVVLFLFGDVFVGGFVDTAANPEVIDAGVRYLRVVSFFYIIMGTMNVCSSVLRGAGDMRVFVASTLTNFSLRVIMAYILAVFIGYDAVAWSVPFGWGTAVFISVFRYRSGKWKEKSLIN